MSGTARFKFPIARCRRDRRRTTLSETMAGWLRTDGSQSIAAALAFLLFQSFIVHTFYAIAITTWEDIERSLGRMVRQSNCSLRSSCSHSSRTASFVRPSLHRDAHDRDDEDEAGMRSVGCVGRAESRHIRLRSNAPGTARAAPHTRLSSPRVMGRSLVRAWPDGWSGNRGRDGLVRRQRRDEADGRER
jgi:hypothetical protein